MAINLRNRFRVNNFIIFLSGILIISVSIWVVLLILEEVYGRYEISGILPTKQNLMLPFRDEKVAILYSRNTEVLLPEGSAWLRENVDTWKKFIETTGLESVVISDSTIERGKHFKYKLIILPASKALSEEEILQLKKYVENGGSIFATGGTGSFTENGDWRGWNFLSETFGIQFTREVPSDEITKIHTLRADLPVTAGIPTGYTFQIATWDRPMACEVLEPRAKQVSFWYDFQKDAGWVKEEVRKSAGIVCGKYGKGRFIWMGFELNSVIGGSHDYVYFGKLFQNSINWLSGAPTVTVKDWPGQHKSAAIITPFISKKTPGISNVLNIISGENIPLTFFIHPDLAKTDREFVKDLAKYGDLNVLVDLGSIVSPENQTTRLDDYKSQLQELKQAKNTVEEEVPVQVKGASPLHGIYNQHTVHALISAGYEYIISDSLRDRAVPEVQIKGKDFIVSFTKTARDDNEIIQKYGLTDPDFQLFTYTEDIDRILFQGGIYVLKLHSESQLQTQYAQVVKELTRYMQERDMWITTASEIKDWWASRNTIEVNLQNRTDRRVALAISNAGKHDVNNFVIQININKTVDNIEISSDIFGTPSPDYTFDQGNYTLDIEISKLRRGETLTYFIDYDNVNS
jgi:hypothetical protein